MNNNDYDCGDDDDDEDNNDKPKTILFPLNWEHLKVK